MLLALRYLFCALSRLVLSLRYRVRVQGLDRARNLKGPVLILPNHPGLVDPMLVLSALYPALHPRPMAYEGNFKSPPLALLAKLLNVVLVPDLDQASAKARSQAQAAVDAVVAGLRQGEHHILWPSGRTQRDGVERLGGARAVSDILQAVPEAQVVLVRTRGVWGSTFSYAPTGEHPHLTNRLLAGAGWLLANLLVFMPRRRVAITVEKVDRAAMPEPRRDKLNPWLEEWYNRPGAPETPTFVPYHFAFGPRTYEFPKLRGPGEIDVGQIKPEIRDAVNHLVADKLHRPLTEEENKPETTFDQLGLDSLDRMDLNLHVEQQYGFSSDQVPAALGELWALAQGLVERGPPRPAPPRWFTPPGSTGLLEALGDTIPEAFVNRALACRREVAAADDLTGAVTYERLLAGARVVARRFARLPAPNVGLMLPASVASDGLFLTLQLAGKLPVILNWTTGPANLAHAARVMGLTHVVTSHLFIDRTAIAVEGVEYLYLEDMRKEVRKVELLRSLLAVRWLPGHVRKQVPRPAPDQPAVVLFTSGSEKAPKAVPLTHANIVAQMRGGIPVLGLRRDDSILGFLPMFHSFGLSVTSVLPLLGGMRVVHHPDPTDAAGLARKIAAYKPTLLVGTPTFISYILERAAPEAAARLRTNGRRGERSSTVERPEPEPLSSLRMIIVGAEACPASLRARCAELAPSAHLLEGYGITECAPVVSTNTPTQNRPGSLGKPLPGVEVLVTDLETNEVLPPGRLGMLLVSGPTVFPGYIAHDGPPPFVQRDGKRWYVTGDLVQIDEDGYIHFNGRLKRFLKAGGEMISLPALEEPFVRQYPPTQDGGPRVAVEGVETDSGRRIVLFSTEPINLRDANAALLAEGFRGVMRLDEVRRVDKIPVLGTGKTDYKALRAMIQQGAGDNAPLATP